MQDLTKYSVASLNGILAILFGFVTLIFPGITIAALGIYFAVSVIIGGIALLTGFFKVRPGNRYRYSFLVEGIIGIMIGVIILARPSLVAKVFVVIMGLWAIIIGLKLLFDYVKQKLPSFSNTFVLFVSIISLVMGIIIIANPFRSVRVITVIIGLYAIIYGVYSLTNSVKYREF